MLVTSGELLNGFSWTIVLENFTKNSYLTSAFVLKMLKKTADTLDEDLHASLCTSAAQLAKYLIS
jgi:hypothetical protein